MDKKLSNIQGMRVPKYSQNELKSKLSKDDLWEFLVNVYPDAIKHDASTDKEISIVIDVQSGEQQSSSSQI